MRSLAIFLSRNINGAIVAAGVGWLYHGVAGFSVPAANMTGGVLLIAIGAYPYLKAKRAQANGHSRRAPERD